MPAIVDYVERDSLMHRLHPLAKLSWALAILLLGVLFSDYRYTFGLYLIVLVTAAAAKVWPEVSRHFKGLFIVALVLFVMQVLFLDMGKPLFYLIPAGSGYLGVSMESMLFSLAMATRMLAIITSFLVFLATTKTQDLVNSLVERMKIPYDYAFMFLTSIRFVPTFMGEVRQISDAQKARGFVLEGWNPVKKIMAYLPIAVPLVLLSLKKAQQMALAMETRGYGSGERTHLREVCISRFDITFMVAMVAVSITAVIVRINGLGTML